MIRLVTISKEGAVCEHNVKQFSYDTLYKVCGFKTNGSFGLQGKWGVVELYGKTEGKSGFENEYEFPFPLKKKLYGKCVLVKGGGAESYSVDEWNKFVLGYKKPDIVVDDELEVDALDDDDDDVDSCVSDMDAVNYVESESDEESEYSTEDEVPSDYEEEEKVVNTVVKKTGGFKKKVQKTTGFVIPLVELEKEPYI